jgi:hypothetical protein
MAGYALNVSGINDRAGAVATQLWNALEEAHKFKLWLDDATHTDAALGPTGIGVTSADLTIIRAAASDLGSPSGLWGVAHSQSHPAANNDFFFNAKQLGGIYWTG